MALKFKVGLSIMNKLKITVLALLLFQTQTTMFSMNWLKKDSLHTLCKKDKLDTIKKRLKKKKTNLNERDKQGNTPLHIATLNKRTEIVEELVTQELKDIDCTIRNKNGNTAFDIACIKGYRTIARHIYNKMTTKASPTTIFVSACKRKKLRTVQYLVEVFKYKLKSKYKSGLCPINIACQQDLRIALYVAEKLDEHMLDIMLDACTNNKRVTLGFYMQRFKSSDQNIQKALRKARTSPELLFAACKSGHINIVKYLLGKSADVEICNKKGNNSLDIAIILGKTNVIKEILKTERGQALLNKTNDNGLTPLGVACGAGKLKIAKLLIETYKVNKNIASEDKTTPYDLAEQKGHRNITNYFIDLEHASLFNACKTGDLQEVKRITDSFELDLNEKRGGYTPMHVALNSFQGHYLAKHFDIVRYLLSLEDAELDLTVTNKKGDTLADAACTMLYASKKVPLDRKVLKITKDICDALNKKLKEIFFDACERGRLATIKYLVEQRDFNIKQLYRSKGYAIDFAQKCDQKEIVLYLKKKSKEIKVSPLAKALKCGRIERITYFVENDMYQLKIKHLIKAWKHKSYHERFGVEKKKENPNKYQYEAVVLYIAQHLAKKDPNLLYKLCKNRKNRNPETLYGLINYLLKKKILTLKKKYDKKNPMDITCLKENLALVRLLLAQRTPYPLHRAVKSKKPKTLKVLVDDIGCDPHMLNQKDETPLDIIFNDNKDKKSLKKKAREMATLLTLKGATHDMLIPHNKIGSTQCPKCGHFFGHLDKLGISHCKHAFCLKCLELLLKKKKPKKKATTNPRRRAPKKKIPKCSKCAKPLGNTYEVLFYDKRATTNLTKEITEKPKKKKREEKAAPKKNTTKKAAPKKKATEKKTKTIKKAQKTVPKKNKKKKPTSKIIPVKTRKSQKKKPANKSKNIELIENAKYKQKVYTSKRGLIN